MTNENLKLAKIHNFAEKFLQPSQFDNLKNYVNSMLKNTLKLKFINYWRTIDKKIFLGCVINPSIGVFRNFVLDWKYEIYMLVPSIKIHAVGCLIVEFLVWHQ